MLEIGVAFGAAGPRNQLRSAGGLLSALQSSSRASPCRMGRDEVLCRILRALGRRKFGERERERE